MTVIQRLRRVKSLLQSTRILAARYHLPIADFNDAIREVDNLIVILSDNAPNIAGDDSPVKPNK